MYQVNAKCLRKMIFMFLTKSDFVLVNVRLVMMFDLGI
jgi:hypothetical protein